MNNNSTKVIGFALAVILFLSLAAIGSISAYNADQARIAKIEACAASVDVEACFNGLNNK